MGKAKGGKRGTVDWGLRRSKRAGFRAGRRERKGMSEAES